MIKRISNGREDSIRVKDCNYDYVGRGMLDRFALF